METVIKKVIFMFRGKNRSYGFVAMITFVLYIIFILIFKQRTRLFPTFKETSDKPKATVYFGGRTGNFLFSYASLIGISRRNNLIPIIAKSNHLYDVFKLPIRTGQLDEYVHIKQKLVGSYETMIEHLEAKDTYLHGYWQSWKYFENVKDELLKKHLLFHDDIDEEADVFLLNAVKYKNKQHAVIIGVHVRRGDFVRQRLTGFTAAPISYYYKAMNYFRRKYPDVLFIMISNDVYWAEDHLDQGPDVYYSHNTPDKSSLDLAILTKCNHTVITSGSFSWWAGYLSGGDVVYYHLYPEPNTRIGNLTIKEDYYPPKWIPM